jgi:L-seryl-tRNA(Ser) seleniumtransferase
MSENQRNIPAVEKVLQALGELPLPRPIILRIVRREIDQLRQSDAPVSTFDEAVATIRATILSESRHQIRPVINGTGILIHTNLGRTPLPLSAVDRLAEIAANYNNLEFNLNTGDRGKRGGFLELCLAELSGAPAATVVNNCASALVIILRYFVKGDRNEVIISRSQLVEIGGGFRIPDILLASGATLKEIGTTNKTTLADYENAINEHTALILKVHQSNFYMGGFVETPDTPEIAALADTHNIPFAEDLGSGAIVDLAKYNGVDHEPTPTEIMNCYSGDKILGGPQAGIIAGRADYIAGIKKEPFFRAVRCDKLILSLLESTAIKYLNGETDMPLLEMLTVDTDTLKTRAEAIIQNLTNLPATFTIGEGESRIGGGTMPTSSIPSITLDIAPEKMSLTKLARRLRDAKMPIIGHTGNGVLSLDLRTIFPRQDSLIKSTLSAVLTP